MSPPTLAVPRVDVDDELPRITEWRFAPGARAGVEHDVVNAGAGELAFVEIEHKRGHG